MQRPLVLIHGYSDTARGFTNWRTILTQATDQPVFDVRVAEYKSLTNEISIKDIAEGLDRALRSQAGLSNDEDFDAIVHSTGMLVIRSWLTTYPSRRDRLKHLIALAPATWGSPLAHKGRSWLGSLFKGSKDPRSPDFLEAGNGVLDGLELGSRFTWDLAHRDLFSDEVFYGPNKRTPYVFVFCGDQSYKGIRELVNEPGTDGTVRIAGCSLNSRKMVVDLTEQPESKQRATFSDWKGVSEIPVIMIGGKNHGTIMSEPNADLVDLVRSALAIDSEGKLKSWIDKARSKSTEKQQKKKWQQFVLRVVDERGDPIPDYNVRLYSGDKELREFTDDVHVFSRDKSLRNFHVNVTDFVDKAPPKFNMRIIASTGTEHVGYLGYGSGQPVGPQPTANVQLSLDGLAGSGTKFFFPYTTTMVEIKLNREPIPLGKSQICVFR
jgi:pimeloyl-ACP methyl ester carboxylesterase